MQAAPKQIGGPQLSKRTSFLPPASLHRLVSRGPTQAIRECLKNLGYGNGDPTCSVVVQLDPVKGAVCGEYQSGFYLVLSFLETAWFLNNFMD